MMRRAPMKPGAGLKRSAFIRSERKEAQAVMRIRKAAPARMTPIRASARDEQCTLRFPCCNFDPATTVWCHSNHAIDGKGMGIKARDEEGCYGCAACHAFLDGGYAKHMPQSLVDRYFDIAREMSLAILRRKGLIQTTKSEAANGLQSGAASKQENQEEIYV